MAKISKWSQEFSCSADTLYGIITNPEFHMARSALLDNPSARSEETLRTDERLKFTLHCTEYHKGVMGIDRSKTEETQTHYKADNKTRKVDWTYDSPQGKRVKVWGSMEVTESGAKARLSQTFNVDISIPLVGGKIEGIVLKETEKFWPRYEKLVNEFVAKAG